MTEYLGSIKITKAHKVVSRHYENQISVCCEIHGIFSGGRIPHLLSFTGGSSRGTYWITPLFAHLAKDVNVPILEVEKFVKSLPIINSKTMPVATNNWAEAEQLAKGVTNPTIEIFTLRAVSEPVKGEQAGMLGVPGKAYTQKRPYETGQMEFESYAKYKKATMSDRFTIDCSYCGFLTSGRTLKEALETAGRLKLRHQSTDEKITIFDRLAQRGACNNWDMEGQCIGYKELKEKEAMNWKTVAELKQMCSQRGLPTDGKKEDLIRRLK